MNALHLAIAMHPDAWSLHWQGSNFVDCRDKQSLNDDLQSSI